MSRNRHLALKGVNFGSFLLFALRRIAFLPHRLAAHFDAVGVMNQPVEDAVGQSGITNLFVPARDRQLRGQDRGAHLVTIFGDLPKSGMNPNGITG